MGKVLASMLRGAIVIPVIAAGMLAVPGVALADELIVQVTPTPASIPAPGGAIDYRLQITAAAGQGTFVDSLLDDKYGNLDGRGTCAIGFAPIDCRYSGNVQGAPGSSQRNTVAATGSQNSSEPICGQFGALLGNFCATTPVMGSATATVAISSPAATGQRAAALKKCKKKFARGTKRRRKCVGRARKLPV